MSEPLNKILHIEDEPDIQEITKMALETVGGFTVKTCGSGDQALAEAQDFKPDLFLLDVMMPGMDGPTTFQKLQRLAGLENIPVVFMTAKVMESEVRRFLDIGAIGVLPKPFDPMTLPDQLREIWDNHYRCPPT